MTFKFDGVDVSSVNLGGVPVTEVQLDGVSVWTSAPPFVLDEHFSIDLFGNSTSVVSGIDADLFWIKSRAAAGNHLLFDKDRGVNQVLSSNLSTVEATLANSLTAFNSDGYDVGSAVSNDNVGWSFKKAQGFMDIVSYGGEGSAGRTVAIELDDGTAVFGMSIVKKVGGSGNWAVQHRSLGGTEGIYLNLTNVAISQATVWNNTDATTTVLTLGTDANTNSPGINYISYNFAHNPSKGIFCGEFNASGGNVFVDLSWTESIQYIMARSYDSTGDWIILDITRGITKQLSANLTSAESTVNKVVATTGGFTWVPNEAKNYIFMAIRGL